ESASRKAAANQISIANSVSSLRFIGSMDWHNFVEQLSVVEKLLSQDPSNQYAQQDFATRDRYRHAIEDVARLMPQNKAKEYDNQHSQYEISAARMCIDLASTAYNLMGSSHRSAHVGYYLIDDGLKLLKQKLNCQSSLAATFKQACSPYKLVFYVGSILIITVLLSAVIATALYTNSFNDWLIWLIVGVAFIGSSSLAVSLVNLLVTQTIIPHALPRLDFSKGVPEQHRTIVVIPTLISSLAEIDSLLEALEIRYLGNRDANLWFALLTDFRDAPAKVMAEDAALIAHARSSIKALNSRYSTERPCIFYLFHRQREWNAVDKIWMGYERKRGKLEQFNTLLRNGDMSANNESAFTEIVGDIGILNTIKYVITLDTDTQLPRDSARKLIGNMAHLLNRPVFDVAAGRIKNGYAILQPRATTGLMSANQTWFTKLYAGESGMDPYTREVSDVYQDIFAEGSFVGKGIYDVDAFRQAVDGRFPNNLILSHDLLESGYARSALVSDVDLIEEYPATYTMDISRRHRWVRGDWQLSGWLLPRVPGAGGLNANRKPNPLSALSIWKIVDNLRRSLNALSLFILLVSGWLIGSSIVTVLTIQAIVLTILFLPAILSNLIALLNIPKERSLFAHLRLSGQAAMQSFLLALLSLVFLPYEAAINSDAILRSAGRMLLTKRNLLLWHSPVYTKRNACASRPDFYKEMWIAPAVSLVLVGLFAGLQTFYESLPGAWLTVWILSAPILLLWFVSPLIAWWISKPITSKEAELTLEQSGFLHSSARRTWRYFDQFVTAEENWLPPDNVQFYPAPVIASRTSPTNIGMGLLANLAAYDFGYITATHLLRLTENTLTTMEKLTRYHGHFYNWYDTRTLQVLNPQYVSSVDSGNLAGCLLTLQAGLLELKNQPLNVAQCLRGLNDTLVILAEHVPILPAKAIENKIKLLQEMLQQAILNASAESNSSQRTQSAHLIFIPIQQVASELLAALPSEMDRQDELMYWVNAFNTQVNDCLEETKNDLQRSYADKKRCQIIDDLVARANILGEMDFTFLYDYSTDLLSIGFDVGERRRDPSCYDLLASEARLASFLLIAQGQLPQKHWFSLGRLLTSLSGEISLLSWSGSMFEYLMPQLMMPSFENTLLNQTCKAVVRQQIKYGQSKGVPWGISESCYNATDIGQVYQYRAFGVPGLGFKRGLADDLVIAPYASALALMVMPNEACKNLQKLASNGFVGQYGFYEAIDYTPNRLPRGKNHAPIHTFMAHHQGMSLLSFAYVLMDKPMQRRFMSVPSIKATELLLQERIPKQGATLQPHSSEVNANAVASNETAGATMRVFNEPSTPIPEVHLLSNGRYHVMATSAGGGYSRWHDLAVTRWREDATQDNWGTFIYLRDVDSHRYWSSAHQPTLRKADFYEAVFSQARAEYRRRDQSIETHTEISVSPEDDVEIRRITLTNLSARTRRMEITSYAEVVLAPQNADLAHRSFSNLFVQTEILHDRQAILCTRRPRTKGERVPWMFHLMAVSNSSLPNANMTNIAETAESPTYETDRAKFIGRGRSAANPIV
ncbi:MAG: glucoamylase family protein, partial [Pseudomonadota bacterium]